MDDAERSQLIDAWFHAYADRVLAYLLHRTDSHTAHDLVQEVFVIAFSKSQAIPDPPIGWLFGTARRLLANRNRGLRRRDQLMQRVRANVTESVDSGEFELRQAFADTLAALGTRDREVLTLSGWYGLRPEEAAQALDCSTATYSVRLHRARQRLIAHLRAAGHGGTTPAGLLAEALRG